MKILNIIKEEIENFDFLGIEKLKEDENIVNILNDKNFQTQFVNDVLTNIDDKNKFKKSDVLYKHISNDTNDFIDEAPLSIDFNFELIYNYNNQDIPLTIFFDGENIYYDMNVDREYQTHDLPGSLDLSFNDIDWNGIKTNIYDSNGDEIEMNWLKKSKYYGNFVKAFVEPLLNSKI
jgi:hypothetical protein